MSITVAQLIKALQACEVKKSGPSKKKRSRGNKAAGSTPGTSGATVSVAMAPARKKKRRNRKSAASAGETILSRRELLATVKTEATVDSASGSAVLDPINFPWLGNIAKAFERSRWEACSLEWRPAVGANTDGTVAVGVDWGETSASVVKVGEYFTPLGAIERASVLACTPVVDGPVWQKANLSLPTSRLQSRQWYEIPTSTTTSIAVYDRAPGTILWHAQGAKGKTFGEIWVNYRLRLNGTRKV